MRIDTLPVVLRQALLATLAGRSAADGAGFSATAATAPDPAGGPAPRPVAAMPQPATSVQMLVALAAWTRDFTLPEDPQLADIARAVELRVRVELARHDVIA